LSQKHDLAVAMRVYPGIKKVPIFSGDKIKLFDLCAKSFKETLGSTHVKFFGVLDGCTKEYDDIFEKYFGDSDLELIHLDPTTDGATMQVELDTLSEQNYSDLVYFAEDDYFYFPDEMKNMITLLSMPGVDFVSPYNDIDYYNFEMHDHRHRWISIDGRKWRNVLSSVFTFLTKKSTLLETKHVFETFSRQNMERPYDLCYWLTLTKINAKNPIKLYKILRENHYYFRCYLRAWKSEFKQLAFGKKYNLFVPDPSIATHMFTDKMAPNVDWQKEFDRVLNKIV
jgi:hypothetical protein